MNYTQALRYLNSFDNFEKTLQPSKNRFLNLDRMHSVLKSLGNPEETFKVVLVGGTNGKGSTAFYLSHSLSACGYQTGLYTSPHLVDVRERIAVEGEIIPKRSFSRLAAFLKDHLDPRLHGDDFSLPKHLGKVTYFEILTLLSLLYFKEKKVEVAILEVGLGGRLDATNSTKPCLTILTPISHDHTHILGNTLKKIAQEKSYLIQGRHSVVSVKQALDVAQVLRKRAKAVNSKIIIEGRSFKWKVKEGQWIWKSGTSSLRQPIKQRPNFLLQNQALVLAALKVLKIQENMKKISFQKAGRIFQSKKWPGRFELISQQPKVLLDGVHNPAAARVFTQGVNRVYGKTDKVLILALAQDKDATGIFKELGLVKPKHAIVTRFEGSRSCSLAELKCEASKQFSNVSEARTVNQAYKMASKLTGSRGMILITGSLYLVGEARKMLKKRETSFVKRET